MAGFLEGLANLATGGMYGKHSGSTERDQEARQQGLLDAISDPEKARAMSKYSPGIGETIGNLLSGGIYGQMSGMNEKMGNAQAIRQMLMQDEINRRLAQRMQAMGMGGSPTTPQPVQQPGAPMPMPDMLPPNQFQ